MTPFEFGILLHYYARANDWEDEHGRAPILPDTLQHLRELDLLKSAAAAGGQRSLVLTKRGEAFVEFALATPLPIQVWELPTRTVERPRTVDAVDPHAGSTGTPSTRA